MTKSTSNTLKSSHIRFGKRTYFFDVNQAESKKKYLKITECKFMGEGEKRMYNSFILFPENVTDFAKTLEEVRAFLN